jgi:hypothetical protein
MNRAFRDLHGRKARNYERKLRDYLSRVDDAEFLQLCWAVATLQNSPDISVSDYLIYPPKAVMPQAGDQHRVHLWELETLATMLLTTPKHLPHQRPNTYFDCRYFETIAQSTNLLRSLENSESAMQGAGQNILLEIARIAHRQFGWQRGYATQEQMVRFAYVYGQGECAEFFTSKYSLTVTDFMHVSFLLFAHHYRYPWSGPPKLEEFGIKSETLGRALKVNSVSLKTLKEKAKHLLASLDAKARISYLPSILRQFPISTSNDGRSIVAPLPELIMFRATAGLYYDFRDGPQRLTEEANLRFEEYVRELIVGLCPEFTALPSQKVGTKKSPYQTPDVLLVRGGKMVAVIECKATKLTYNAQFADNPMTEAERAYSQLIEGIIQLWWFFAKVRLGIHLNFPVTEDTCAVLLTMDSWMQMSSDLRNAAVAKARQGSNKYDDICPVDMRPIVFCSMQDLADTLFVSSEDDLMRAFDLAKEEKYRGWRILDLKQKLGTVILVKEFPLKTEILLPWWSRHDSNRA